MKELSQAYKFILFALFICCFSDGSFAQSYGLGFSSHDVFQDKRTSLDLNPGKTFCFNGNFDLSFDLSFIPNRKIYFGYIVRIISDDGRNFDLVYSAQDPVNHFNLIVGDKLSTIKFEIPLTKLFNQWDRLKIMFDVDKDQLVFAVGNKTYIEKGLHLKNNACYKILFGTNSYHQFETTDIPPIKLRDIKIAQDNAIKYNWPLDEASGSIAHEVIAQQNGSVVNPVWIAAMHRDWQSAMDMTVEGVASVAFDTKKEALYIVSKDSVFNYSVSTATTTRSANIVKPNLDQGNQSIYNPYDNGLYNFFPDQKTVAKYDFEKQVWDKKFVADQVTNYWHANKLIYGVDTSLYLFGGYGQLHYRNIVQKYSFNTHNWEQVKYRGDFFTPRYLAALGATTKGDTAYILGGYGSISGEQIVNPKNIYDMMRFTVKDKTFKKLFTLKVNNEDFSFANSLVINSKNQSYYGLIFPQNKYNSTLHLISGSLNNSAYHIMGSGIPYNFNDIHSFADLFYCPLTKKFVVVTLLRLDNGQTKVNIYTLLGPPLNINENVIPEKNNGFLYGTLSILLLVVLAFAAAFIYKRRKNGSLAIEAKANEYLPLPQVEQLNVNQSYPHDYSAEIVHNDLPEQQRTGVSPQHKNVILLFGDLQVFDSEGADITRHFTPLIKELFLLILLYSLKKGRGLSSEKLNEILWFDKSAKSARNNRSVNIAKLKSVLDKMNYCQLSKDTGYWKIDIDYDKIYVDYYDYLNIIKDKKQLDQQKIKILFEITRKGNFLSNSEYEWLDVFKSEISNEVIDTFLHFAQLTNLPYNAEFLIEIANFIFYFDPVNEESMILKCKALSKLGKHSLAKNTFESFAKEYRIIYDEDFKKDFHDIII